MPTDSLTKASKAAHELAEMLDEKATAAILLKKDVTITPANVRNLTAAMRGWAEIAATLERTIEMQQAQIAIILGMMKPRTKVQPKARWRGWLGL